VGLYAYRREALLAWYGASRRPLPWRITTDPYAVLVSEVMAQQTQVSRVVSYYERFLAAFPTVEDLAAAPLAEVLAVWSGLGYNRRARHLHAAAGRIAAAGWPQRAADLQLLPGIGPYTAAAVACFAFGEPIAAVDTNVRRVLSRWHGVALTGGALTSAAGDEIDPHRAAEWNQAVMDLGATLCSPRSPKCQACPVAAWCKDPSVYEPPPKQGTFNGSMRQARGAVLKTLVEGGPATTRALVTSSGVEAERLESALAALHREGMIHSSRGRWSVAGGG
jgi:A/G-specific adenine glycosylase